MDGVVFSWKRARLDFESILHFDSFSLDTVGKIEDFWAAIMNNNHSH